VPDPHTLFHGIKTVSAGHIVTWRDNHLTVREWWDISFDSIEEGRSEAWWQEQVLETLDRVIKLEMVADVPLGSFLSGGIDSSDDRGDDEASQRRAAHWHVHHRHRSGRPAL